MAPLAGRLPGRRHLLIDLPGDGLSPPYLWQGAPVREQAVNVIAGVLDGLGIDQIMLVGNSLGGLFGLWFALDRPSRVARAVLVGQPAVAIAGSRANLTMVVLAAPVLGRVATWMARLPSPRSLAAWAFGTGPAPMRCGRSPTTSSTCTSSRCVCRVRRRHSGRCCGGFSMAALPVPRTSSPTPNSPVSPCLFVWPEDDRFLGPAAGKLSVDKIPSARFVTMPGGHFPWYDDPDRCASLVADGL